jgi:nitrous oxide reductase
MVILRRPRRVAAVSLLVLVALASGCGGSTKTDKIAMSDGPVGTTGNAITPVSVSAHKGDKVVITVTNTGDKTHGFTVDGYNIAQTVDAGKTIVVNLKADKAGSFRVWCQLHPTHRDAHLVVT